VVARTGLLIISFAFIAVFLSLTHQSSRWPSS
jgi:hypothetical protein